MTNINKLIKGMIFGKLVLLLNYIHLNNNLRNLITTLLEQQLKELAT